MMQPTPARAADPSGACPIWKEAREIRHPGLRAFCQGLVDGEAAILRNAPAIAIDHFTVAARFLDAIAVPLRDKAADELTIAVAIARAQNAEPAVAMAILESFRPRSEPDITLLARGYLFSRLGRFTEAAALVARARSVLPGDWWCGRVDDAALADLTGGKPPQGIPGGPDPAAYHRLPSWLSGPGMTACTATVGAVVARLPPVRSYHITFALNSTELALGGQGRERKKAAATNTAILTQMKRFMDQFPGRRFRVVGRSDEACGGMPQKRCQSHNLALSRKRADAVKDWLVRHGVDPGRIVAEGAGTAGIPHPHGGADHRNRIVDFQLDEQTEEFASKVCPWEVAAYGPVPGTRLGSSVKPAKIADLRASVPIGDQRQPAPGPTLVASDLPMATVVHTIPTGAGLKIRFRQDLVPQLSHIYVRDLSNGSDLAAKGGLQSASASDLMALSQGVLPVAAEDVLELDSDAVTEIELIAVNTPLALAMLGRQQLAKPAPTNPDAIIPGAGTVIASPERLPRPEGGAPQADPPTQGGWAAAPDRTPVVPSPAPPPASPPSPTASPPTAAPLPYPEPVQVITRCTVKVQRTTAL